jgi:hypothetical protein
VPERADANVAGLKHGVGAEQHGRELVPSGGTFLSPPSTDTELVL